MGNAQGHASFRTALSLSSSPCHALDTPPPPLLLRAVRRSRPLWTLSPSRVPLCSAPSSLNSTRIRSCDLLPPLSSDSAPLLPLLPFSRPRVLSIARIRCLAYRLASFAFLAVLYLAFFASASCASLPRFTKAFRDVRERFDSELQRGWG